MLFLAQPVHTLLQATSPMAVASCPKSLVCLPHQTGQEFEIYMALTRGRSQ